MPDQIPEILKPSLMPLIEVTEELSRKISRFDRHVEEKARTEYPATERLRQLKGVGALTSLAYVLVLDDPADSGRADWRALT